MSKTKAKPVKLLDYFQSVYLVECMKGTRPSTRQSVMRSVERFVAFTRGDVKIADVTPDMFRRYCEWHLETNRGAPTSAYGDVVRVRKVLRAAGRCDLRPPKASSPPNAKAKPPEAPPNAPLDVSKFYRDFYRVHRVVSRGYDQQITMTLANLRRFHKGPFYFEDLPTLLNRWVAWLETTLSPRSIKSKRAAIITLWYAAAELGMCPPPVPRLIRRPKCQRPAPDAWTLDEMRAILGACQTFRGQYYANGVDRGRFWEAFVRVCYDTALRRGDMLAVRRSQLESIEGGHVLRTVQSKTGDGVVHVLRPKTVEALEAIFPPERELIFEWPHTMRTLHHHWSDVLAAAGIDPQNRRNGVQKLRRTSASHLERENPGAASAHLGHRSADMARMHYLDPKIHKAALPLPPAID